MMAHSGSPDDDDDDMAMTSVVTMKLSDDVENDVNKMMFVVSLMTTINNILHESVNTCKRIKILIILYPTVGDNVDKTVDDVFTGVELLAVADVVAFGVCVDVLFAVVTVVELDVDGVVLGFTVVVVVAPIEVAAVVDVVVSVAVVVVVVDAIVVDVVVKPVIVVVAGGSV